MLLQEIEAFTELERRRVFHLAYERHFYGRSLDALALHAAKASAGRPRFQALSCVDERQESLRRHLEELAPDAQTFSAGIFLRADVLSRRSAAPLAPLCPAVMQPRHWVVEEVVDQLETHQRRAARGTYWAG